MPDDFCQLPDDDYVERSYVYDYQPGTSVDGRRVCSHYSRADHTGLIVNVADTHLIRGVSQMRGR